MKSDEEKSKESTTTTTITASIADENKDTTASISDVPKIDTDKKDNITIEDSKKDTEPENCNGNDDGDKKVVEENKLVTGDNLDKKEDHTEKKDDNNEQQIKKEDQQLPPPPLDSKQEQEKEEEKVEDKEEEDKKEDKKEDNVDKKVEDSNNINKESSTTITIDSNSSNSNNSKEMEIETKNTSVDNSSNNKENDSNKEEDSKEKEMIIDETSSTPIKNNNDDNNNNDSNNANGKQEATTTTTTTTTTEQSPIESTTKNIELNGILDSINNNVRESTTSPPLPSAQLLQSQNKNNNNNNNSTATIPTLNTDKPANVEPYEEVDKSKIEEELERKRQHMAENLVISPPSTTTITTTTNGSNGISNTDEDEDDDMDEEYHSVFAKDKNQEVSVAKSSYTANKEADLETKKRLECLGNMERIEKEFTDLKEKFFNDKLTQLKKEIDEIKLGEHLSFQERIRELENKKDKKLMIAENWKNYQIQSIMNMYDAERQQYEDEHAEETNHLKERMVTSLSERQKRISEEKESMRLTDGESRITTRTRRRTQQPNAQQPVSTKKKQNPPPIVYSLKENEIMDDYNLIFKTRR